MKREDDQELWDLLGRAAAPAASPFFARNVVREVRQQAAARKSWLNWFRPRILTPAAIFVVALTFAGITAERSLRHRSLDNLPEVVAQVDPQDVDVVDDLDNLVASDDDTVWDDDSQSQ
ncbi:MAG TPA: hypothetical protein VGC85_00380 [Chthoniobacterales bacterium]|jgi:hypothetical protein